MRSFVFLATFSMLVGPSAAFARTWSINQDGPGDALRSRPESTAPPLAIPSSFNLAHTMKLSISWERTSMGPQVTVLDAAGLSSEFVVYTPALQFRGKDQAAVSIPSR
jgi:hypothetical protein